MLNRLSGQQPRIFLARRPRRLADEIGFQAQPNAGIVFDSSLAMMKAALQGIGIALAPPAMFSAYLSSGRIRQPFPTAVSLGSYWLTRLQSKPLTAAMLAFSAWLLSMI